MIMITMSINLIMSGWIHQLWNIEVIRKPRGNPRYLLSRKSGIMIQYRKTLDIEQIQPQLT